MKPLEIVNRANADYIDRLYEQYQKDPRSLSEEWKTFFAGFDAGAYRSTPPSAAPAGLAQGPPPEGAIPHMIGVYDLVHSYRELGHFVANLDPLGHNRPSHPLLDLSVFGMKQEDLSLQVGPSSFLGQTDGTLRDLIAKLRQTYCGTIGVEYTGIADKVQRDWLQQHMEPILNRPKFSAEEQKAIIFQLIASEEFEQFLHTRYVGSKRFSLEGADALIPLLNQVIEHGAVLGGEKMIMAMAHRGRLNVLAHVLNKPYEILISEFAGTNVANPEVVGDGDVKYHLGYANTRPAPGGRSVKVSLVPNPSHLELINPIMQGIVRAQQWFFGDAGRARVVPVLMHGDAAFTGQGVVMETLNLSELPGWRTGGTIHVIVNNQIGFTTPPEQGRFTPYPTDIAKMVQAPIFHVNGDDPEAVVHAARLAIGFRQQFKVDVMLDLWCYRRHGHNEVDEPSFTQPVMYREIDKHPTVRERYAKRLLDAGVIGQAELDQMKNVVIQRLESSHKLAAEVKPRTKVPTFGGVWKGLGPAGSDWSAVTKVPRDALMKIADSGTRVPRNFTVHPKVQKLVLDERRKMIESGRGIDWGFAEMLSLGSMLLEGTHIRFTGQDVERGTFSHRHAVLHEYNTGDKFIPLGSLAEKQGKFVIRNSMLSEFAVLGFEWGFASADPRNLVIWEAQFGDFVNGAQPIIDQILASAESKWRFMNGIVINLPHGYEGQGPEHSNAYIERFLSLCAEENMQVVVPTTPAQYFHMLRRQIVRKFRKPLVCMSPKSLFRYKPCWSQLTDLTDGAFQNVIDDPQQPERHRVRRLLLCTGKVFYTLSAARDAAKLNDVAIVRVEQLYPFPRKELAAILQKYRAAESIVWAQEEPQNRGAWGFILQRSRDLLPRSIQLEYCGREEAASPAVGSIKMHEIEEKEFVSAALNLVRSGPGGNGSPSPIPPAGPVTPAIAEAASPVASSTPVDG